MEGVDVSEVMARVRRELDAVMAFWISHSHDLKHGYILKILRQSLINIILPLLGCMAVLCAL